MIVGLSTASQLKRRLERVVAAEPGVRIVDIGTAARVDILAHHGDRPAVDAARVVELPPDPLQALGSLLGDRAQAVSRTSEPARVAIARPGASLGSGVAVTFPPPMGAQWAEDRSGVLVAPVAGDLAAIVASATGLNGTVRLGVVDHHDYLAAIGLAVPVLTAISGRDPYEVAVAAGMAVAEFIAT